MSNKALILFGHRCEKSILSKLPLEIIYYIFKFYHYTKRKIMLKKIDNILPKFKNKNLFVYKYHMVRYDIDNKKTKLSISFIDFTSGNYFGKMFRFDYTFPKLRIKNRFKHIWIQKEYNSDIPDSPTVSRTKNLKLSNIFYLKSGDYLYSVSKFSSFKILFCINLKSLKLESFIVYQSNKNSFVKNITTSKFGLIFLESYDDYKNGIIRRFDPLAGFFSNYKLPIDSVFYKDTLHCSDNFIFISYYLRLHDQIFEKINKNLKFELKYKHKHKYFGIFPIISIDDNNLYALNSFKLYKINLNNKEHEYFTLIKNMFIGKTMHLKHILAPISKRFIYFIIRIWHNSYSDDYNILRYDMINNNFKTIYSQCDRIDYLGELNGKLVINSSNKLSILNNDGKILNSFENFYFNNPQIHDNIIIGKFDFELSIDTNKLFNQYHFIIN